jgi:hemerythrin-like domain-containing protein
MGDGLSMPKIIDILLEEHQNIEKLLLVLEHELEIFDRSGRPDYEILQTIIQYFQDYPENCQHPKEEMIFEKLKARVSSTSSRPPRPQRSNALPRTRHEWTNV